MPDPVSLFEPVEGDGWLPTAWTRGPWSPNALHGGAVAALLARGCEVAGDGGGVDTTWQPARLTVELLRPVPLEALRLTGEIVRPGRKVQLVDASLCTTDGTEVASARLLRVREQAVDAPVTTGGLEPPPPPSTGQPMAPPVEPGEAFHSHGTEHRFVEGVFDGSGPATDWIRLRVPIVPGEAPTPLQRVAAAADFGNGVSSVADWSQVSFVNPDLTIHLHRAPVGEWICLDAVTWMEDRGLALAESRLWDERGPIGRSLQSLLVDRRST